MLLCVDLIGCPSVLVGRAAAIADAAVAAAVIDRDFPLALERGYVGAVHHG